MHNVSIVTILQATADLAEDVQRLRRCQCSPILLGDQVADCTIRTILHEDIELVILMPALLISE